VQGELVITEPMPSMPVAFWGDADGSKLRAAYYSDYPGVWRHGDWIRRRQRHDGGALRRGGEGHGARNGVAADDARRAE